jgi:sugar/nucleoside kinase (ribokinase family)
MKHSTRDREKKPLIAGTGCSLMDYLYTGLDFSGPAFARYRSRRPGDGGMVPGQLVIAEELEKFTGTDHQAILSELTDRLAPPSTNLGGPSVVALVHAAQMLADRTFSVEFYGVRGDDSIATNLEGILGATPLNWDGYHQIAGRTPVTYALSDPDYDGGAGERSFINSIGVAAEYGASDIPDRFFSRPITAFGGTALVPELHQELHLPVIRARREGSLTVINTVYDFINQSRAPDRPWPLGDSERTYAATDLLIVDAEEARRLSGERDLHRSLTFFRNAGVAAVAITRGAEPLLAEAAPGRFALLERREFPVCERVGDDLASGTRPRGDTTGCGDNFVGGVLAALAEQLAAGEKRLDLGEAIAWGVAAGGFACFCMGGTFLEEHPGEKRDLVAEYHRAYRTQIDG